MKFRPQAYFPFDSLEIPQASFPRASFEAPRPSFVEDEIQVLEGASELAFRRDQFGTAFVRAHGAEQVAGDLPSFGVKILAAPFHSFREEHLASRKAGLPAAQRLVHE